MLKQHLYFDTDIYQIEGVVRFHIGLANHIKILQAPEPEKYVATFVKENLQNNPLTSR